MATRLDVKCSETSEIDNRLNICTVCQNMMTAEANSESCICCLVVTTE